ATARRRPSRPRHSAADRPSPGVDGRLTGPRHSSLGGLSWPAFFLGHAQRQRRPIHLGGPFAITLPVSWPPPPPPADERPRRLLPLPRRRGTLARLALALVVQRGQPGPAGAGPVVAAPGTGPHPRGRRAPR